MSSFWQNLLTASKYDLDYLQSYGWFGYVVPWQPHDHTLTIACTEHEGQVSTFELTTSAIWTSL